MTSHLPRLSLSVLLLTCSCVAPDKQYIPPSLEGTSTERLARVHPIASEPDLEWWFDRLLTIDGVAVEYGRSPGTAPVIYLEPGEHQAELAQVQLEGRTSLGLDGSRGPTVWSFKGFFTRSFPLVVESGCEYSFSDVEHLSGLRHAVVDPMEGEELPPQCEWCSRPRPIISPATSLNLPAPLALSFRDDDVEELVAHKYFSPFAHGPTQHFWHFQDRGVVFQARLWNGDSELEIEATIHVFQRDVGPKDVAKWLNNQHSDGQVDAPTPVSFPISAVQIDASEILDREVLRDGEEIYDVTSVTFSVPSFLVEEVLTLAPQDLETTVYVRVE